MKDLILELDFTANGANGRYGYPIFWWSSNPNPDHVISQPITQQSDPDMLWAFSYCFCGINGDVSLNYINLMVGMQVLVRAEALARIYPNLWLTNIFNTPYQADDHYKISGAIQSPNAQNCFWSYDKFAQGYTNYTMNIDWNMDYTNHNKYEMILKCAEKYDFNWLAAELKTWKPDYFTDDVIEDLKNNCCILYDSYLPNGIKNDCYGYAISQSLYGRSGSGYGWYPGMGWIGLFRTWSKVLPHHFYYKNNSYPNGYTNPSLCVTKLNHRINLDGFFTPLHLGTCITGMPPDTDFDFISDFHIYKTPSEYIRRDFKKRLAVFTNLDFRGNLIVPKTTIDSAAVNRLQVNEILSADNIKKEFFTNANFIP